MTTDTNAERKFEKEHRFVSSLFRLGNGPRAELKRALQQERPDRYTPIFRYVENHVPRKATSERSMYYLVGALFGLVEKDEEPANTPLPLARAIRRYEADQEAPGDEVSSTEKRFLALLDADEHELPHRLRQMVKMITSGSNRLSHQLDWAQLLYDLVRWNRPNRPTQTDWAKDFYNTQDQTNPEKENQ